MSNSGGFSLIVPAAADKPEKFGAMPHIFRYDRDGMMMCVKAITGLNLADFDNIYFTILRKHAENFDVDTLLRLQFKRICLDRASIVILDEPTSSQPETVVRTIERHNISGPIFIKDADSYFRAAAYPENGVAVFPLELLEIVDPRNKSYVAIDDMHHVTNIIEKKIVSNLFSAGGYSFSSGDEFKRMFDETSSLGPTYISHLIYAMLLNGEPFRPIYATEYNDLTLL